MVARQVVSGLSQHIEHDADDYFEGNFDKLLLCIGALMRSIGGSLEMHRAEERKRSFGAA